ncbi:hypothetical protein BBJ28_00004100 [Nothophytophthora sp. Chile5]|nr:hypothetical protein BBJ28_00004100 [Nothophytophthora sp. Chile5]
MLASPSAGPAVLTHLDVRGCCVSVEGATNLLLALSQNKTLTHLNLAQNFLDEAFGDVLADFLAKNDTVTNLQMNDVGIGEDGVTPRLLEALQGNTTLTSVSLAANRMRNDAACAVLRALMKRAQLKAFELVDLSGNLLTLTGLATIARILEIPGDADEQNETHGDHGNNGSRDWQDDGGPFERKRQRTGSLSSPQSYRASLKADAKPIDELCLLNNDFLGDDEYCGDSDPLIEAIQQRVGHLASNEWAPQRQVYDDEI